MNEKIPRVEYPELFFGVVAPISADIETSISSLERSLESFDYTVVRIKVTKFFQELHAKLPLDKELRETTHEKRFDSYIDYGDAVRAHFSDDSFFAAVVVARIIKERLSLIEKRDPNKTKTPEKIAYILYQFKRKEEIDLLRSVYGRLFFQLSVYSNRASRVDNLSRRIADTHNSANHLAYRSDAERLVQRDQNEIRNKHGQRVADIFHEADFIVNNDVMKPSITDQVARFVELIFGSNVISPTKMEYGLYSAKSTSMRSLDLSRQIGAAIFSKRGEIISLGSNEVPKAGGGTYWSDEENDDRDYKRGVDSNYKRKIEILKELFDGSGTSVDKDVDAYRKSQFMDALEYGRMIHAEMSAICDSARLGRAVAGAILYTTTFPCHMCAKHIVAAGIEEVIFLEPYPKSLASELHPDSIQTEGESRAGYGPYPATKFNHFYGISPKRYRDLFERESRKDKDGNLLTRVSGTARPLINITIPVYLTIEEAVLKIILIPVLEKAGLQMKNFPSIDFADLSASVTGGSSASAPEAR